MSYYKKRHSKWYEKIILNPFILSIFGVFVTSFIPAFLFWGNDFSEKTCFNTSVSTAIVFYLITFTLSKLMKYPGNKSSSFILSTIFSWYSIIILVLLLFRFDYSNLLLGTSFILTLIICFFAYSLARKWIIPKIAYIPFDRAEHIYQIENVNWIELTSPNLPERRINGIVADFRSEKLSAEWQRFLANATLNYIPVYNVRQLEETLTGRVKIHQMYQNDLGAMLPSPVYSFIKRLIDIVLILLSFPLTLPIMAVTAIAIRLESEGGAMFIQKRVGQGGKEFNIYKFRSMCKDSEKDGAQFASSGDMRVTRIGKFIRKTRIDELPQFFNVLKGDMSLIGPRPEQKVFVDRFDAEIPFYNYRHIVKPGISGWAQVVHGYVADTDDTRVKLEHDFYYIRNFSLWLDILIVFKTLKTMLTGFGAR